mmetsp:Transcript_13606/g.17834  ORF Transcript_13606/g.17834 Transcript_13606/m.17834 type:complete len:119 (+) Transcript_13606:43-399(+)
MIHSQCFKSILLTFLLMLIGSSAFLSSSSPTYTRNERAIVANIPATSPCNVLLKKNELALLAKKGKDEDEENSSSSPLKMLFLYMTPWKNPNSIFVYMFVGLYWLGKISEARHNEMFP